MTRKLIYDICSKFYFKSTRASATTRMCCVAVVSDEERQYLRFFSFQLKIPDRYVLHFLTSFIYRYWEDYYMPKLPECTVKQPKWSLQSAAHGQTKKSRISLVVLFCSVKKCLQPSCRRLWGRIFPTKLGCNQSRNVEDTEKHVPVDLIVTTIAVIIILKHPR